MSKCESEEVKLVLAGWRSAAPGPGSNTEMIIPAGPGPRQYIEMHTATIMGSWAGGGGDYWPLPHITVISTRQIIISTLRVNVSNQTQVDQ